MTMDGKYKLKWLNGLLAARELVLPAGELRLGSGEADIAVALDSGGEAWLCVDDDGVRVRSALPVWVDGRRWDNAQPVPLRVPVDLGGLAFLVGTLDDTLAMQAVPGRERAHARHNRRVAWALDWRLWCLAALSLAGGATVVLYPPAHVPRRGYPASAGGPDVRRWDTVSGVAVTRDADGVVILSGSCARSSDVDALRRRLIENGQLVRDETICADTLRRSVRDVLSSNGYLDATVKPGKGAGSVVIDGDFSDDARWRSTARQLRAIPGLASWTISNDRVQSFDRLLLALHERNLLEGVSLSVSGATLMVSGHLPLKQMHAVMMVLHAFNAGSSALRAEFHDLPPAPPRAGVLPAPIVSVGGNAGSIFVELANGMRLQRGAALPSGFAVYALDRAFLALRRGQQLISVPLGI